MDKFTDKLNGYLKKYWMPEILAGELLDTLDKKEKPSEDTTPQDNSTISD